MQPDLRTGSEWTFPSYTKLAVTLSVCAEGSIPLAFDPGPTATARTAGTVAPMDSILDNESDAPLKLDAGLDADADKHKLLTGMY